MFRLFVVVIAFLFQSQILLAQISTPCTVLPLLQKRVSEIRNLPLLSPINCEELTRDEYIKRTNSLNQKVNALLDLQTEEAVYKVLKIIPKNFPYARCSYIDAGDMSIAFYDYQKKSLVFRKGVKTNHYVIAHEFTHALQDQHFQIAKTMTMKLSTDAVLATSAVREGDAMVVEDLYTETYGDDVTAGEDLEGSGYQLECEPPPLLKDIDTFPYDWGMMLMRTAYNKDGFAAINRYLIRHPDKTSALFYPDKMDAFGNRIRPKDHFKDSLGEFLLRRIFANVVSKDQAISAAKGLRDDTIVATNLNPLKIEWRLTYISEAERIEAQEVLTKYVASILDSPQVKPSSLLFIETNAGIGELNCGLDSCLLKIGMR